MFPFPSPDSTVPTPKQSGYPTYRQSAFGGAWTAPDRATVDRRGALAAQKVQYFGKKVGPRYGFATAISFSDKNARNPSSMFEWLSALGNYLVWSSSASGTMTLYATKVSDNPPVETTIAALANFGHGSFASAGPRLYVANWAIT